MAKALFKLFDLWDSDDEDELMILRELAEELDAEEAAAEEAANNVRVPRTRIYIRRDRELAGDNLYKHYFSDNPVYPETRFKRRFRMSSRLFKRIVNDIINYDVDPLPLHFEYFKQKNDAIGRQELYVDEYLWKPTSSDIARLYSAHEEKHGFKGMLGSIDCMHWKWKNCPNAWKGQYISGHQGHPTIVFEAVASYDTWIWHAFFDAAEWKCAICPFTVNGNEYTNGYYLADGIYPDWSTLMKAYSTPTDEPRAKFKRFQESARKDVERTFGILQGRFHILQMAGRPHTVNKLRRILYCCVLLHNMIVEDNGFNISWLEEELLGTDEANPNYVRNRSRSREVREQEIRDRNIHDQLRNDLTEHIWAPPPDFRSLHA
ncbi:uncharacterized protein [Rutidosis leptorrhynchoides]|uniref:uncharacterized protein n=1 Tax=Rutidosis leptorrhynchoides TaxID=125765 RepID=UPI003A997FD8